MGQRRKRDSRMSEFWNGWVIGVFSGVLIFGVICFIARTLNGGHVSDDQ